MKKKRLFSSLITVLGLVIGTSLIAQEYIELSPYDMNPDRTGYYVTGIEKDKNNDGTMETYKECDDEYDDSSHFEAGTQQGFTYANCMIMPTCWPKNAIADDGTSSNVDQGYIQMGKSFYPDTDSASLSYIITPALQNLTKIELQVSPDKTHSSDNPSNFDIEFSTDNGVSWSRDDKIFIRDYTSDKGGETKTYDADDTDFGQVFSDFATASEKGSIIIKITSTWKITEKDREDRVKVHNIKIYADIISSVRAIKSDISFVKVNGNTIYSENGEIQLFNTLGQYLGSSEYFSVKSGIYIVRTQTGETRKLIVN